jgi:Raf kinase inhibitor-like YbhB/YbcL family protein
MRAVRCLMTLALVVAVGASSMVAQDKGGRGRGKGGRGGRGGGIPAPLMLKVAGYEDGGMIPSTIGCSGGQATGASPKIDWSGAPAGTQSFALILHDTDVDINGEDVLHWAIFNIPATSTGLPAKVANTADLPDGSHQLNNIAGMPGFFNPCPPAPTVHHYIIEVYALDSKLEPAPSDRAGLMAAMKGHVRAKGTYTGVYHQ